MTGKRKRVLFAWLGLADQDAATGKITNLGPIGSVVSKKEFDHIVLLFNYKDKSIGRSYKAWLNTHTKALIEVLHHPLTSPTNHREIYDAAVATIDSVQSRLGDNLSMFFHISPGTPAMHAIWILLEKTKYDATLIESSKEEGVQEVVFPFNLAAELIPTALRLPGENLDKLLEQLPSASPALLDIIASSKVMRELVLRARLVAHRNVPVLLLGESGTGKEMFARAIHEESPRKTKPFIPVNCGAIPSEIIESELFGHEKGAFTGAIDKKDGYFKTAHGGTLFLDEIGELPLQAQVKLLRALQERQITPVGKSTPIKIDVQLISATNRNLIDEVHHGRFREDLFHRLAIAVLSIPPLREREGDIEPLIYHCLGKVNEGFAQQKGYTKKSFSIGALSILKRQQWPGNIRELLNTITRACLWSPRDELTEHDIRDALLQISAPELITDPTLNRPLTDGFSLNEVIGEVARHYLERACVEASTKVEATRMLDLGTHQRLGDWLKKYDISAPKKWRRKP